MDHGLDKNKPPSTSYRETFRRHRKLLCLPMVLGALAAAFFLFGTGKTYKSTANLWVDTAPPVPSSVSANGGATLAEPPAAAEQGILSELLTTRSFAVSVVKAASRGKAGEQAAALLGNGKVVAFATGPQVLQINYSASSPAVAQSVLAAIVTQLRVYTDRLAASHDQATAAYDRAQVKTAATALSSARSSVATYHAQHPGATASTDPTYASLVAAETNAATQLAQANTTLSQAKNSQGWSIQVTDAPGPGATTPLRKSKIGEVILAGVLGGVLVSFLAVVALTPGKKEAWEDELPIAGPLAPDVPSPDPLRVVSPPPPAASAQSSSPPTAAPHRRLSLGNRGFAVELDGELGSSAPAKDERFEFLTPSARSEQR